jgi:hypothetical protein
MVLGIVAAGIPLFALVALLSLQTVSTFLS